ncbi:MAG: 50S ribosomal protein L23 [bacterium]
MGLLDKVFKKNKDNEISDEKVKKDKAVESLGEKNAKKEEVQADLKVKNKDAKITKADSLEEKQVKKEIVKNDVSEESYANLKISKFLIRPLMTEKVTNLAKNNMYVFEVVKEANKIEVKKAIKDLYGVLATDVNIINIKGKKVGRMRKVRGKRKNRKKAIIKLKKGDSINVYGVKKQISAK